MKENQLEKVIQVETDTPPSWTKIRPNLPSKHQRIEKNQEISRKSQIQKSKRELEIYQKHLRECIVSNKHALKKTALSPKIFKELISQNFPNILKLTKINSKLTPNLPEILLNPSSIKTQK